VRDDESILTAIGRLENTCPNCGVNLESRPSRKTKCLSCGAYIYARARPFDKQQVLVNEEEANLIDKQWQMVAGIHDALIYNQKALDTTRKRLLNELGRQPTENEVKAFVCEREQIAHAKEWDWGLYRNDRFQIAEFQRAAGRIGKALMLLLEVCYLDLNGPNNCGGMRESPDLLSEYPPFKPDPEGLAPAIIDLLNRIAVYLGLDLDHMRIQFIEIAGIGQSQINSPLSPRDAWEQLRPRISMDG